MSSWSVRFMLLLTLTLTLLGAELTGICHVRRIIPSLEVITVQEEGESPSPSPSPPSKGHGHYGGLLAKETAPPPGDALRRHYYSSRCMMQEEEDHGVSASKRVVPEGPNPLHN